jgi:tetratricopeptide (TPR) repeat protein
MIIVEPTAQRYEVSESSISTDEHLLERISAAENRIDRLSERMERCLDLLLRTAQNSYFDRSLVKALIELLSGDGVVEPERLEHLWNETCQSDIDEQEESLRRDEVRLSILARATGPERQVFEELINEGFLLIDDYQVDRGIGILRRAADLGDNAILELFIGEHFFRKGKTKLARTHLQRAHQSSPENLRTSTLLGLTCADDGDLELAKQLLRKATNHGAGTFAAHYGLGRLFVAENDWARALAEFKLALNTRPSPEAHYVLACLYYQLERDTLATRHLRKALRMDGEYSEALYLLALIHQRNGNEQLARQALAKSGTRPGGHDPTVPLFKLGKGRSRRLMMGADKRLTRTLREEALREADPA